MSQPPGGETPLRITPDMLLGRRLDFERRMPRVPRVTVALLGVLAGVFALQAVLDAFDAPEALLAIGALSREAVLAGEWWRLLSATLLHAGTAHLVGNAVALYILGMVCEHAFGGRQFLLLYVGAGLAGSVLSALVNPGPSVGASGAIFGLQGAAVVLFRRHRDRLLVRDRRIGVVLLVWAVYSVAGGLLTPFIDNGAHVGGFAGGAVIARRLHPVVLSPMEAERAARVRRAVWVVAGLAMYMVLGVLRAV